MTLTSKMSSIEFELEKSYGSKDVNNPKRIFSTAGKILIGLTGCSAIGLSVICLPFVAPAFRKYCLPFVPATNNQIDNIFKLLKRNTNERLLDIGSGDGRIVIAAAKNGLTADGVELNTWLVQYSRLSALYNGVFKQTSFYQKDLWKFDVSPYKYIVIFGVEQMMTDLEKKLLNEANKESQVIACRFPLPNIKPCRIVGEGIDTVWLYDFKKQQSQN